MPVVKDDDDVERSVVLAWSATVTVTVVSAGNPAAGVKTAVFPCRAQDPATAGFSVGIGAEAGSGSL